jgi:uncharacterized protein (TIGR00304 family)
MQLSEETSEAPVWTTTMQLFFVGFLLTFIGFIVLISSTALQENSSVSGGLIIFIGPLPIILGSGPYAVFAILLAVILTIIGFIMFFVLRKQAFRSMVK